MFDLLKTENSSAQEMMKELPSFKPIVRLVKRNKNERFFRPPYTKSLDTVVVGYVLPDNQVLTETEEKEWEDDRFQAVPEFWYEVVLPVGRHPNHERAKAALSSLADKQKEALLFLYSFAFQLRLATNQPSAKRNLFDASEEYEWYKYLNSCGP